MKLFQPLGYGHLGDPIDLADLLHGQFPAIAKRDQVLALVIQISDGLSQIFKSEVPEDSILHGTPDTIRAEQHRFKLTFTQVPC